METLYSEVRHHRALLQDIAHRAMIERGLLPDFSPAALAELDTIQAPAGGGGPSVRDLRALQWCSIDNDDSRDLDQLTVAQALPGGHVKVFVAVADVDSLVKDGSAIDGHARHNTTSVYTAAEIFPMLPEKLSTDLTSLGFDEDRAAIAVEMEIGEDGTVGRSDIYPARVHNRAKLAYNSVAAWLEGEGPLPEGIAAGAGLAENLRLQDRAARSLDRSRELHGALSFETTEARPVFEDDRISDLKVEKENSAKNVVEEFMIAANGVTARYLSGKNSPSIRRVVRTPKRWDRIVDLAEQHGYKLPGSPDSKALEEFLLQERAADPLRFPDLSLAVIKLLGSGEYTAEMPGGPAPGHFGLAVNAYTHSTAPNRRYADLITQRLLKAALAGRSAPYTYDELAAIAAHLTEQEDAANKVERQVGKSAAALLLQSEIGKQFDGIVTGASPKGTWVRLLRMPVEGKVVHGFHGMDVGDRVKVELVSVDVEKGFIDFKRAA